MWDSQIAEWYSCIENLRGSIMQLEEQGALCGETIAKIDKRRDDYCEMCDARKRKALVLYDDFPKVRFAGNYGLYMEQVLEGTEQKKIIGYYDELVENICEQQHRIENDIQENYRQIEELEYRIAEAERQREAETATYGY